MLRQDTGAEGLLGIHAHKRRIERQRIPERCRHSYTTSRRPACQCCAALSCQEEDTAPCGKQDISGDTAPLTRGHAPGHTFVRHRLVRLADIGATCSGGGKGHEGMTSFPLWHAGVPNIGYQPTRGRGGLSCRDWSPSTFLTRAAVVPALLALALAVAGCGGTASSASAQPTATPTTSPTPTLQPFAFQDPLSAPDQYDWQNGAGCSVEADGYHINTAAVCLAPSPPVAAFADGTVSVQAKQMSGPLTTGYSLVFRAGGSGSVPDFYAFLIDGNGKWRAFKVIGGQATFFGPFAANPAIHTGLHASNTLQVVMTGSHFDFYVNGTKVGQADDSALPSGTPGLFGNVGIEVVFTNFRVQQTTA